MENIRILNIPQSFSINIDRVKYLLGNDFSSKYAIVNALETLLIGGSESEYSEESGYKNAVTLNDSRLTKKNWMYFLLHPWMNFDDELKLNSKSILLRYLESVLSEIEFEDTFHMVNQSIELLNTDFITQNSNLVFQDLEIASLLKGFNCKTLTKFLAVSLTINELGATSQDLKYQEKIVLYLKMAKQIANKNVGHNIMLVIDSPTVHVCYQDELNNLPSNLYIFIIASSMQYPVPMKDIALFGNQYIDLGDEESVYENLVLEYGDSNCQKEFTQNLEAELAQKFNNFHQINLLSRYI